jgi:hypothetical protein
VGADAGAEALPITRLEGSRWRRVRRASSTSGPSANPRRTAISSRCSRQRRSRTGSRRAWRGVGHNSAATQVLTAEMFFQSAPHIASRFHEHPVHSRTPISLRFSIRLPSVTTTGRWREQGRVHVSVRRPISFGAVRLHRRRQNHQPAGECQPDQDIAARRSRQDAGHGHPAIAFGLRLRCRQEDLRTRRESDLPELQTQEFTAPAPCLECGHDNVPEQAVGAFRSCFDSPGSNRHGRVERWAFVPRHRKPEFGA